MTKSDPSAPGRRLPRGAVLLALACVGVTLGAFLLWSWRTDPREREFNSLKAFGIAYHNYAEVHGTGPSDVAALRYETARHFRDEQEVNPSLAYEWIESGRLEVAWNGSLRFGNQYEMTEAGVILTKPLAAHFIAREVSADAVEDRWLLTATGVVVRDSPSNLAVFAPLPPPPSTRAILLNVREQTSP